MRPISDVILELLAHKTDAAKILSVTSRYRSGAGDREGWKKEIEKKTVP